MLKSILNFFRPNKAGTEVLKTAILLTQQLKSHLHVIYAHQFLKADAIDTYGNMKRYLDNESYQDILDKQTVYIEEEKDDAIKEFERITSDAGIRRVDKPSMEDVPSVSWEHFNSHEHDGLLLRGSLNDLIISGGEISDDGDFDRHTIEIALFNTRRPVLIVPSAPQASIGRNVLVGWNRSAQSAVALSVSLPILQQADKVEVFSIDTGAKKGPPAEDAVEYLSYHGVKADLHEVPRTPPHVGEIILDRAADFGADLLVMGAYSHSRVREMILGGVTQHIFDHARLPILMAH